jgi:hypothetical protein
MCEYCTRREFMQRGVGGGLMLTGATWAGVWTSQSAPPQPRRKARIGVIFTGSPGPADRDWGADDPPCQGGT